MTAPGADADRTAIIVDDEPANQDFLVRLIQHAGYKALGAASGAEALKTAEGLQSPPSLIIVDSELPDTKGIELIKEFRKRYPTAKIVMATMLDDRPLIWQAFENGCDVFLVKPHGFMELFKRLQKLGAEPNALNRLVIDAHGIRPFKP